MKSYADRLADFITRGQPDNAKFNEMALTLFRAQYANNAPYRTFCDGRGVTPKNCPTWKQIPAAPASAFKRHALTCAPEEHCSMERGGRVFHSSGTTSSDTSRHFMDNDALFTYSHSLRAGYRMFVGAGELPYQKIFALMPPPEAALQSSLSYMLGDLAGDGGHWVTFFYKEGWQSDLADALRGCEAPVTLFGTAFAWVLFFDAIAETFPLFHSTVLETGGFKGRSREISRDELYALFTERLNVPEHRCVSEYGMSEMASQFYDSNLYDAQRKLIRPRRKLGPFWARTRVLDPVTGLDCEPEQPGLLAHYDLANVNSVLAIQTEDLGYKMADGDGFVLLGRAPGAVLRGCSLLAEETMQN